MSRLIRRASTGLIPAAAVVPLAGPLPLLHPWKSRASTPCPTPLGVEHQGTSRLAGSSCILDFRLDMRPWELVVDGRPKVGGATGPQLESLPYVGSWSSSQEHLSSIGSLEVRYPCRLPLSTVVAASYSPSLWNRVVPAPTNPIDS
jgi:hypothetical protein